MTINHIVNMLSPSSTSPSPRPLLHAALLARATYRAVYYRFSFFVFIVYCLSFIVWRLTDCTLCDVGWASAGYPSPTWWATSLRALGHVRPRLLSPHSLISVVEPLMTSYRRWPLHWHQHVPSLSAGYPSPTWWATSLRALGHVRPRLLSPHSLISVVEPLMTSYRRWPLHWHQHVPSLTSTWAL